MEVITVINQKGGVAKTTTAQNIGAGLVRKKKKVLFIDLDPQKDLTTVCGVQDIRVDISQFLTDKKISKEKVQSLFESLNKINYDTETYEGAIIPGSQSLTLLTTEDNYIFNNFNLIKEVAAEQGYNFIIIDCPPNLSILTVGALYITNRAIIPTQADIMAFNSIRETYRSILQIAKVRNEDIKINVLIVRYDKRLILNNVIIEELNEELSKQDIKIFDTYIRETVVIREAQANLSSVFIGTRKNKAIEDFKSLVNEILKK